MNEEDKILERLAKHRTKAPEGFTEQVMDSLPAWSKPSLRERCMDFWPTHGRWITPAFAGAAVMWLVVFGLGRVDRPAEVGQVTFHFELHAPGAERVELLGTFNEWKSGDIVLNGPEASGHWTAEVALPEGRHEYRSGDQDNNRH